MVFLNYENGEEIVLYFFLNCAMMSIETQSVIFIRLEFVIQKKSENLSFLLFFPLRALRSGTTFLL